MKELMMVSTEGGLWILLAVLF
ncbi:rCG30470 [Rattus norvegicus]|uniref:RCG30470 n=1 Tax=Rattus norvegicus TaxID=10116 RepID=A6JFF0_RAT|nr:rCG30470 [Rattus norvegicus]